MHSFINAILSGFSSKSYTDPNANSQRAETQGNIHLNTSIRRQTRPCPSKILYCHHDRSGSAGSTEYWIWNGPEGDELETSNTSQPKPSPVILLGGLSEPEASTLSGQNNNDEALDPLAGDSVVDRVCPDDLTTDSTTILQEDASTGLCLTPLLPSMPFLPPLQPGDLTLGEDSEVSLWAFHYGAGLTNNKSPGGHGPLIGLGLTREDDPSQFYDGLGLIRLQSSPWRSRQQNDNSIHIQEDLDDYSRLSQTFLQDLEAFFLAEDSRVPTVEIVVEEPKSREEGLLSPQTSTPRKTFSSLTPRRPSRSPFNICATVSGPDLRTSSTLLAEPLATLPRSLTTSNCCALSSGTSSSASTHGSAAFVRSTCSAFSSQRNRISSTPFFNGTRHSLRDNEVFGSSSGVLPSTSARNLTVSVSMGPGPSGAGVNGLSCSRSLQSHTVRDLSVVGTISSDLKKVSAPLSRSVSISGLKSR